LIPASRVHKLALLLMWLVLAALTNGIFLTPRNLYNLSIQTV
jgi:D-xylose transport system permease protein